MHRLSAIQVEDQRWLFILVAAIGASFLIASTSRPGEARHPETGGIRAAHLIDTTQRCTVVVEDEKDVVLAGGSVPYVAPWSMAASNGRFLLAGGPAYVWPAKALAADLPSDSTDIVGIVLERAGTAALVRNPFPGKFALHPRVAPRADGGWYVLLVESDSIDRVDPVPRHVNLWLGAYDDRWVSLEPIGAAYTHLLRPEQSSELVVAGNGELGFAYALSDGTRNGLVLLRRLAGGWRADTLGFDRQIHHVDLRGDSVEGAWNVLFLPHPILGVESSSFSRIARFDGSWSDPAPVVSDRGAVPQIQRLYRHGDGYAAIWAVNSGWRDYFGVRWGMLDASRLLESGSAELISQPSTDFVAVPLDAHRILILTRTAAGRMGVAAHLLHRGRLDHLGEMPVANVTGPAAALDSDGSVLMVTTSEALSPGALPIQMTARRLRLRC
jgi:hypothetical protein